MDKGQILRDYREAKNQKRQIPILADLNVCTQDDIKNVLQEGGYLMVFNPNGVDVSMRSDEIKKRYADGEDVTALSKAFYVSRKGIRQILGIEEDKTVAKTDELEKENQKLHEQINELVAKNHELSERLKECEDFGKKIADLESENKALNAKCGCSDDEYKQMCIRISQLTTTIDVLVDRFALLRSVTTR